MIELITSSYTLEEFNLLCCFCKMRPIELSFINLKNLFQSLRTIKELGLHKDEFDIRYRYNKYFFSTLCPDYSEMDIELFALYFCSLSMSNFNTDAITTMEKVVNYKYPNTKLYNYMQHEVMFMLLQLYTWFNRPDDAAKLLERFNQQEVKNIDFTDI